MLADYGVPQRRVRCVIVASRKRVVDLPPPTTPTGHRITVQRNRGFTGKYTGLSIRKTRFTFAEKHSKITIDRLQHISHDGGSRDELPAHLRLQCHKKLDDTGEATSYCDVYGRMRWDTVAPTLTTGCTDVTKGRYAHPVFDRAITLREAALLQTFPIDYRFYGNSGQIARQIGNAVPVNLAKNLALIFLSNKGDEL